MKLFFNNIEYQSQPISKMAQIDVTHQIPNNSNSIQLSFKYPNVPNIQYKFEMHISLFQQNIANLRPLGSNSNSQKAYYKKFLTLVSKVIVNDLKYGTMYHVQIKYKWGSEIESVKNVYCSTPMEKYVDFQEFDEGIERYEISRPIAKDLSQQSSISNSRRNSVRNRPLSSTYNRRVRNQNKNGQNIKNINSELSNSEVIMKMIGQSEGVGNRQKVHRLMLQARNCRNLDQFINEKEFRHKKQEIINKKMMVAKGMMLFQQIYKHREGHEYFGNDWFMGPFYSYNKNEQENKKF